MNKHLVQLAIALSATGYAAVALGHGHPIIVAVQNDRLVVSGGIAGAANGYANQIYVETGSEGDPQDADDFPNFGPAVYWTVPGFQISGLTENSGLYLQALARPVKNANPAESRTLWYRNDTTNAADPVAVAPASSALQIRHDSTTAITLLPTTIVAPPSMKLAAPVAADMGFHNHNLVKYLLPYPLPDYGAYAFFARLTSDAYAPSDPFLVVINNGGLSSTQVLDSAAAINRTALLAGDYNHDDVVNSLDYIVWRNSLNSTTQLAADGSGNGIVDAADLITWRQNFGVSFTGGQTGVGTGQAVPEPAAAVLVLFFALTIGLARWRRTHSGRC